MPHKKKNHHSQPPSPSQKQQNQAQNNNNSPNKRAHTRDAEEADTLAHTGVKKRHNQAQQQAEKEQFLKEHKSQQTSPNLHHAIQDSLKGKDNGKGTQKKNKKKKKGHHCHCCKIFFAFGIVALAILFLQETVDPDSSLTLKIMESELMQDLTGPIIELPGVAMNKSGYSPHFPVVFIPGIISTGLEVWQGRPCAQRHFRQRFWGTTLMIRKILLQKQCWLDHVMLTPEWEDPPGIKLRSAQGLVASDYLVGDYWVWARIIENLALIGYDESNMYMGSYDWRLPFRYTETRDHYFSKYELTIVPPTPQLRGCPYDIRVNSSYRKVVMMGHSMGSNIALYFLRWVEHHYGNTWVGKNIEGFINIGGPLLGVPKTLSAVLSGEMRDTAELNPAMQFIKENLLSRNDMVNMFRSFGSVPAMLPKGGARVWIEPMISVHKSGDNGPIIANLTLDEAYELMEEVMPDYMAQVNSFYDLGRANRSAVAGDDEVLWANPLLTPLPHTPLRVFCLYGAGKQTEVGYHYRYSATPNVTYEIETSILGENIQHGVVVSDGDGTVPLVSLGYMCVKGWKNEKHNPSKSPIITREYVHGTVSLFEGARSGFDGLRGGVKTADHVDIMGNHQLLEDVTKIVSNNHVEEVVDRIESKILELVADIDA